ncbi:transglutaminaseTgpA domain-containing protein [Amycolatopsis sp. NPDC051758]|uniref:transglutaminase family protein n=1 Tax=Amycolatopsis sp. NPDC051758 TaxID=3363935 RepID=UPI0037A79954
MIPRLAVLAAAAVAGLLFQPVFGLPELLAPVLVPIAVLAVVAEVCHRRPGLRTWQAVLLAVAGLLAVSETVLFPTTLAGLPTVDTLRALFTGATGSWRAALRSTWPARAEPELLLFVPLLVVLAGTAGLELLTRLRRPLLALAPSAVVVVVSQLFSAATGWTALLAALAYGACVVAALLPAGRLAGRTLATAVPLGVTALVAAALAGLLPSQAAPSLQDRQPAAVDVRTASPLDGIAARLAKPAEPVFDVRGPANADRWPLAVLDDFDGVEWRSGDDYRGLGRELAPPRALTVPVHRETATISVRPGQGPWLPSQSAPAAVSGTAPLVEERQGSLLAEAPGRAVDYTLSWWAPDAGATGSRVDPAADGGLGGIGTIPPGISELAAGAMRGLRPTLESALVLERFFRENYRRAVGPELPTGHGWPQLREFLLESKRGTSEQFATAYVVLARSVGIPARVVVGYRLPAGRNADGGYTVRNGDVFAWPEVAVKGAGWVPLDPGGGAAATGAGPASGASALAAKARASLPPSEQLRDPPVAPPEPGGAGQPAAGSSSFRFPVGTVLIVLGAVAAVVLAGVPGAKAVRSRRRRRRPGAASVLGAYEEVRDRLRDHRIQVTDGMTVRDYARLVPDPAPLRTLASLVDSALWTGRPVGEEPAAAWRAVADVRAGLGGSVASRVRAALDPRTLLSRR